MIFDGLTDAYDSMHMVQHNSMVSRELGISREEQDAWAYRSHQRAAAAQDAGPLRRRDRLPVGGDVTADESIRRDTSLESLAQLKPVFDPEGTTTAGNAPGVNDGASCVIVTSEEFAQRRGLEVLATILAQGYVADDFAYLVRTPANAAAKAFEKAGKTIDDVKRVEINEAFASVALNSTRLLGADEEIVNVNGGAVALGHPIGASGGRIVGDDGARAAPERRRARARGDLLRRRPGRRAADRGLTALPRLRPALAAGAARGGGRSGGAAGLRLRLLLRRRWTRSAICPRADAAFVGTLLFKDDERPGEATYVFAVERVVKGTLGSRVQVRSGADGAVVRVRGAGQTRDDRAPARPRRRRLALGPLLAGPPAELLAAGKAAGLEDYSPLDEEQSPPRVNWGGILVGVLVLGLGGFLLVRRLAPS